MQCLESLSASKKTIISEMSRMKLSRWIIVLYHITGAIANIIGFSRSNIRTATQYDRLLA